MSPATLQSTAVIVYSLFIISIQDIGFYQSDIDNDMTGKGSPRIPDYYNKDDFFSVLKVKG